MMTLTSSLKLPHAVAHLDLRDPIEVLRQEKLITANDIRRAMSTMGRPWTLRRATDWMANDSGCAFQLKRRKRGKRKRGQRGGPWYITKEAMRTRWPHIMVLIDQERVARAERDDDFEDFAGCTGTD